MSEDRITATPQEPLGAGKIIGESFAMLFRHPLLIALLAFIPSLLGLISAGLMMGWGYVLGSEDPAIASSPSVATTLFGTVIEYGFYDLTTAFLVLLAYDIKLKKPLSVRRYLGPALKNALPIIILAFVVNLFAGVGIAFFILPGLLIMAVYAVVIPAIVIEGVGFEAMTRSSRLTEDYRWPIAIVVTIMLLCAFLPSSAAIFVFDFLRSMIGGGTITLVISVIVAAFLTGLSFSLTGISAALIYARLREIKEGVSVDNLAAVFE